MWRCRRNIDALSDRCIALWKPTNLELEVGRIRTASYDVVSNIIPSSEQWANIDKRGGVSTNEEQRNRIRGFLVDYANEQGRQAGAPTSSIVSDVLRRVEVATKKLVEALDNLDAASPTDANAVRRMRRGLTKKQTDDISRMAVGSAAESIHSAIRRTIAKEGTSFEDYGAISAQEWQFRLRRDCVVWNIAANVATKHIAELYGDSSPTPDWAMRRLLTRLEKEYVSVGGITYDDNEIILFVPWVAALIKLLNNPPSRNALERAVKRWREDRA